LEKLNRKTDALKAYIAEKGKDGAVIAFSGGVDSSTLAALSLQVLGDRAVAVTAESATFTTRELADAKKTARDIGIKQYITQINELDHEAFAANPPDRCYHCKKELLKKLVVFANAHGFRAVFDGTNLTDLSGHRPGYKAVQEAEGVYSPLVAAGFTKDEVRELAKTLGLNVHDKPPQACIATRIPYHERITTERLKRVAESEEAIRKIVPVQQLRVRDHNGLARIEVGQLERKLFYNADVMEMVALQLKRLGFKYVALDLEGYRSGSMLQQT
jgi:uncharacterized protein